MNAWLTTVLVGLVLSGAAVAVPRPSQGGDPVRGKAVYHEQKCSLCHKIDGSGGTLGQDLSSVGAEQTQEWLERFLLDPKKMNPTKKPSKMPPVKVEGDDLKALVAYLSTLKQPK